MSAVCVCEHRGELDEEKPRFVQCKVELESTVASLRHILISPGLEDGPPGQGRRPVGGGARYRGEHGRAPGLAADCSLLDAVGGSWHAKAGLPSKADCAKSHFDHQADLCQAAHG